MGVGFSSRHKLLRSQIASLVRPVCENDPKSPDFAADFIAEALINWSVEDVTFDELYPLLNKILKS